MLVRLLRYWLIEHNSLAAALKAIQKKATLGLQRPFHRATVTLSNIDPYLGPAFKAPPRARLSGALLRSDY